MLQYSVQYGAEQLSVAITNAVIKASLETRGFWNLGNYFIKLNTLFYVSFHLIMYPYFDSILETLTYLLVCKIHCDHWLKVLNIIITIYLHRVEITLFYFPDTLGEVVTFLALAIAINSPTVMTMNHCPQILFFPFSSI